MKNDRAETYPAGVLIGERLRARRERRKWRQDDVAQEMRWALHLWERSTVAAVEAGSRALSITEQAALCGVFRRPWADLLALDEDEDGLWLRGVLHDPVDLWVNTGHGVAARWVSVIESFRDGAELHWGGATPASTSGVDETDRKAAKRLGWSAEEVRAASLETWGRSLADERDHVLGPLPDGVSARTLQARRGHVTRDLLAHLRAEKEGRTR